MSWAGLSGFGNGAVQGYQNGQQIQQRAQQIQQGQMALDAAKNALKADAAAFANLGQPMGGGQPPMSPPPQGMPGSPGPQMTQPMAPGQPSVPAQPQGGGMGQPQQSPISGLPGGAPPPPQAQQPMPQGQPQQPAMDPTDPQAPVKALFSIAQEIKSRNPRIDPQELMMATQRVVEMSKGLDPAMRASMQLLATQLRNQTSTQNTEMRTDAQRDIAGQNNATRSDIAANRDATIRRGQDLGLQKAEQQASAAMQRVQAVQSAMNQRFAQGQGNSVQQKAQTERVRAISAQLQAATRQLAVLKNSVSGQLDDSDPRVQKAMRDVAEATTKLDVLEKAVGSPAPQAPAAGGGQRGPAQATLHGKPIWPEGNRWVFEDGSEAK